MPKIVKDACCHAGTVDLRDERVGILHIRNWGEVVAGHIGTYITVPQPRPTRRSTHASPGVMDRCRPAPVLGESVLLAVDKKNGGYNNKQLKETEVASFKTARLNDYCSGNQRHMKAAENCAVPGAGCRAVIGGGRRRVVCALHQLGPLQNECNAASERKDMPPSRFQETGNGIKIDSSLLGTITVITVLN
ncbi:hypothetical protein Bbelb_143140 [Branchiostoma belcheri]|nr:hypothetical protein Bbelb_143140 [Branchiostoma belcheri]